jgi:hypothetical protein
MLKRSTLIGEHQWALKRYIITVCIVKLIEYFLNIEQNP